jgi:predicted porin
VVINGKKALESGVSAEYSLGMFFRADDGGQGRYAGDTYFGKNSYVGLSSGYGTVRIGRQSTGNFLAFLRTNSFGDSPSFGPAFLHNWVAAIAQGSKFNSPVAPPLLTAGSRTYTGTLATTDSAWNNSVVYMSPSLGGAVAQLQWAPSEVDGVGARVGGSVFYVNGPLNLALATEQIGSSNLPTVPAVPIAANGAPGAALISGQSTWQLSGAYAFGWGRLSAGVFNTQRNFFATANDSIVTTQVGATIVAGPGNVLFQIANSVESQTGSSDVTRTTTSLGYRYPVTKEIDAYAVMMNDQLTGQSAGNSYGMGIRYRF